MKDKNKMTAVLRFAPSPTGFLHVGNIRTCLANWLYARQNGGQFILRLDDTDLERSTASFRDGIIEDLKWLGLDFDNIFSQSDRAGDYDQAIQKLKGSGRLYPCFETSDELKVKRAAQMANSRPPQYDRAALDLTADEIEQRLERGENPHWRLKLNSGITQWADAIHGNMSFEGAKLSDPVLLRADGTPVYTLTSVVDDRDMGITHVFRGDDHIANTAVQIQLHEALGTDVSTLFFGHMPLVMDEAGKSLSKRIESLSIRQMREKGIEAPAILAYLQALGTASAPQLAYDSQALIDSFDAKKISKSSPKFSLEDIAMFNEKFLHHMPYAYAKLHIQNHCYACDMETWELLKGNITVLKDLDNLLYICRGDVKAVIEEADYIKMAIQHLPSDPWTIETWSEWTSLLKAETGRKGKSLFMPLRLALTGQAHGPDMKSLLSLIGRDRALLRLSGQ